MAHLHDALIGRWVGEGAGHYPTIDPFTYRETIEITPVPDKPMARWSSTSEDGETGAPRHGDVGFLRSPGGTCELVLAHAFGITEICVATPERAGVFEFESVEVACAPTAKSVSATRRTITVTGDVLEYDFWMAAVGVEMTHHLAARLQRV